MKSFTLLFSLIVVFLQGALGQTIKNSLLVIGYQNDTPVVRDFKSNDLFSLDNLSNPLWEGGEMTEPYYFKKNLFICTQEIPKGFAWVIYKDFEEVRMQIFDEAILYPVYDGGPTLYYLASPPSDSSDYTLRAQDLETGQTQLVPHIAGAYPYNLSGTELIYGRFVEAGGYPWVDVIREDIANPDGQEEVLLSNIHLEAVFCSLSGEYLVYYNSDEEIFLVEPATRKKYRLTFDEFWETQHQVIFDESKEEVIFFNMKTHQLTPFRIADLPLLE